MREREKKVNGNLKIKRDMYRQDGIKVKNLHREVVRWVLPHKRKFNLLAAQITLNKEKFLWI